MTISLNEKKSVATISLSRPEKLQALNYEALEKLTSILSKLSKRKSLKGLVICSKDARAFSAGLDIFMLQDANEHDAKAISNKLHKISKLIRSLKIPSIAAIDGYALGAGLEIALSCSFRVANNHAVLGLPQVHLGFTPGGGATQLLPKIVGAKKAQDLIVSGEEISAKEAYNIGLVDRLVISSAKEGAEILLEEILEKTKNKRQKFSRSLASKEKCEALPKSYQKETENFVQLLVSTEAKKKLKKFSRRHRFI